MTISIRDQQTEDRQAVRAVISAAFGRSAEADLVEALEADGDCVLSLVATEADVIVGHVLYSRMRSPPRALALAPVSVLPTRQRTGIGSALIRAGLVEASNARWESVIVLGDPQYYGRFGFKADALRDFTSPFAGPYLQSLALNGKLPPPGPIAYAPAFSRFE